MQLTEFEKIIKKGTSKERLHRNIFVGIFSFVILANLATINGDNFKHNLSFSLVMLVILGVYYLFNKRKFKSLDFWLGIFTKHADQIIWIKPITTKHKVYAVITVAETYQFQVYLKDGNYVRVECPKHQKKTFYNGIRKYAPHAHLGYSQEVKKIYRKNKKEFLNLLNQKGLLRTINDYNL